MDRRWLSAMLMLTGALGLSYELVFVRMASEAFGATSEALGTVLSCFMGGLALGSFWFGKPLNQARDSLRLWGILEIAIGLWGLATPTMLGVSEMAYGAYYDDALDHLWLRNALRFALLALVITPPAVLMGGALPLAYRASIDCRQDAGRGAVMLYAANNLGALAGCLLTGVILIPQAGIRTTLTVAASLSCAQGVTLYGLSRLFGSNPGRAAPLPRFLRQTVTALFSTAPRLGSDAQGSRATPALLAGAVGLGSEVVWARYVHVLVPGSAVVETGIIAVAILGIAAGALVSGGLLRRQPDPHYAFALPMVASAFAILLLLGLDVRLFHAWTSDMSASAQALLAAALLFPISVCVGAAFPWLLIMPGLGERDRPMFLGRVLALNTLGGIAGAVGLGLFGLRLLGIVGCAWLLSVGAVVAATRALFDRLQGPGSVGWRLIAVASTGIPLLAMGSHGAVLRAAQVRGELVALRQGRAALLTVERHSGVTELRVDGMWQGSELPTTQAMAAHLPALLHGDASEVLVLGVGAGQTAKHFLRHPLTRLEAVDLEPEVTELIASHFDARWLSDARTRVFYDDALAFLKHRGRRYDIISVELGQAFRPVVAKAYTREFYRAAKRRLQTGGVLVQMLSVAHVGTGEFALLARTFVRSFKHTSVWFNRGELLLMGSEDRPLTWSRNQIGAMVRDHRLAENLDRSYWGGAEQRLFLPASLGGAFLMADGLSTMVGEGPEYSSDRPFLEFALLHFDRQPLSLAQRLRSHADPIDRAFGFAAPKDLLQRSRAHRSGNLDSLASYHWLQIAASQTAPSARVSSLQKAVEAQNDNVDAQLEMARTLGTTDLDRTISAYRAALSTDPLRLDGHRELAQLLLAQRRVPAAAIHLEQALLLAPGDRDLLDEYLHVLKWLRQRGALDRFEVATGRADSGARYALLTRAHSPEASAYRAVARHLGTRGFERQGARFYWFAEQVNKPLSQRLYDHALALRRMRARALAATQLRRALSLDPGHRPAALALASLLASQPERTLADAREALTWARRGQALGDRPDSQALGVLASAYHAVGDSAASLRVVEEAYRAALAQGSDAYAARLAARRARYAQVAATEQPATTAPPRTKP